MAETLYCKAIDELETALANAAAQLRQAAESLHRIRSMPLSPETQQQIVAEIRENRDSYANLLIGCKHILHAMLSVEKTLKG